MLQHELTVFSVFHKAYTVPHADFIKPIQVGRALTNLDLGFITDDTGNNISSKNGSFCELTALYWIWKNLAQINSNFIGFAHYRRYFCLPEKSKSPFKKYSKTDVYFASAEEALLKATAPQLKTELLKQLAQGKVILPVASKTLINDEYKASVKDHFIYNHIKEEWDLMEEAVLELYPDYKQSFELFKNARKISCCNMFISNKNFIAAYCEWIFNILFLLEKRVKLSGYFYQSRLFGFFSERLINLFILHNKIQAAQFPVVLIR